jgi:hypothetical protein
MKRSRVSFLATVILAAVASLFTVCKATGVGGGDPLEGGGDNARSVKAISAFSVTYPVEADGEIDEAEHTIAASVPYDTDVTGMTATFKYSGASAEPASGMTDIDFTTPKTFTVTAADGSEQAYKVTVTAPPPRTLILNPLDGTWKDGSGFSGLQSLTLDPGEGVALPSEPDKITNSGHFLVSWNTAPDASGTDYLQGQHFVPDGDITLYARWASGNAWVDKTAAEAAISAAENAIQNAGSGGDGGNTVIMIGNPSAGDAPQPVLDQIDYLMGLLDGHRVDVSINDNTATITVTLYNVTAIEKGTADLNALVDQYHPSVIVVPKWTFVYNGTDATDDGSVQSALLVTAGTYEIELEGAAGGHLFTYAGLTASAGKGGHVLGRYRFDGTVASPTELEVRVGGQGEGTAGYDGTGFVQIPTFPKGRTRANAHPGGWNGGGSGGASTGGMNGASGGGGATDVRLKSETNNMLRGHAPGSGTAYTSDATKDPRIIVAGGGGGAAGSGTSSSAGLTNYSPMKGGDAGDVSGYSGEDWDSIKREYAPLPVGTQSDCSGGTIAVNRVNLGTAGIGGNGVSMSDGRGGGGAGWWGGSASKDAGNGATAIYGGGAGGSGYTDGTEAHPEGDGVLTNPYDPSSPAYSGPINETIPGTAYGSGKATIRWIKQ